MTAGAVYHDGMGELEPVREALAWYPRDLWLWQLAGQWRRIAQEEPFCGRADEAGADRWPAAEEALVAACREVATRHNRLGLTEPLDPSPRRFFDRPYLVLDADRFTAACLAAIDDRALAAMRPIGAIDQFVDSTEVLGFRPALCRQVGGSTTSRVRAWRRPGAGWRSRCRLPDC